MKDFALVASASRMPFCQIKFLRFLYKGAANLKPRVDFYIEKSRKHDFEKAIAEDSSEKAESTPLFIIICSHSQT
jgi:hypothetical protein